MVDVTLIRPLNKGQGHSFWYQFLFYYKSTTFIQAVDSYFFSRTHRTDRQTTTDRSNTVASTVAKNVRTY